MRQLQHISRVHLVWTLGILQLAALIVSGCDLLDSQGGSAGRVPSVGHGWRSINPDPTAEHLSDVDFADNMNGWAVGFNGTILHSGDGGKTWTHQQSVTQQEIRKIRAVSPRHAWALSRNRPTGTNNVLLHTSNGGKSWDAVDTKIDFDVHDVFFNDERNGFLAGSRGTIARTTDGGLSWTAVHQSDSFVVNAVHFINERAGWAVASRSEWVESNGYITINYRSWILKTEDRGNTWSAQALGIDSVSLSNVFFVNEHVGWITGDFYYGDAGSGVWFKTEDGGESWTLLGASLLYGPLINPYEFLFLDEKNGWAAAAKYNALSRTSDGGQTWSRITVGEYAAFGIDFNRSGRAWTVGTRGRIFSSLDHGTTWKSHFTETAKPNNSLKFFDADIGVGLKQNTLLTTTDGGKQWTEAPIVYPSITARSAFFTDPQRGWVFGKAKSGVVDAATVIQTLDGGYTWSEKYKWNVRDYLIDSSQFYDLRDGMFTDALHGWAVGASGVFLSSNDGGENWTGKYISKNSLLAVKFINNDTGWAIGVGGIVLFTPDGGQTWSEQTTPTSAALLALDFVDAKYGWIAGEKATLLHTNNGGATWTKVETGLDPYYTFKDVDFVDRKTGWICGNGIVLGTSDGGLKWNQQFLMWGGDFSSLYFLDNNVGWAGGKSLIQTTNGGE